MRPVPPRGRVLYVTYDGLLEPLGGSQVLPYVLGVRAAGIAVSILSFEKAADLSRRPAVEGLAARLRDAGVPWIRKRYHGRPVLPATAWDVVVGRRALRRWRAGGEGPCLVHARGYLPAYMARAVAGSSRILFDMRGFWVDERVEAGRWRAGSVAERAGRMVERGALEAADHLVLLTRAAVDRVGDLLPGAADLPVSVIPTCVDTGRFRPADDPGRVRRELGLGGGPVLVHTGTLTGWYDGPATAAVARAFVERTGGRFVVLTRQVEEARRLASEAGVEAVVRSVPHADMPRWLQAADAGLALVRPSPAKEASYPTKIGEYLATGLAVLATGVGDVPLLAREPVVGLWEGGSAEEGAAWAAEAVRRPDRVRRARGLACRELSIEEGVRRLLEVYRSLGVAPAEAA